MSEFKLCKNGHYYPTQLEACPYCPKPGLSHSGPNQLKNTIISNLQDSGWDHTRIEEPAPVLPEITPLTSAPLPISPPAHLAKTQLLSNPSDSIGSTRKLVGWLVSYSMNPNGTDFRLYEGRNLIGGDPACDVVVPHDPAISARHLVILYRVDGYRFKDELSTNGTFVNDQLRDEGILHDGDTIRVGNTVFRFRSAL